MAKIQINVTIKKDKFSILSSDYKTKHCSKTVPTSTLNKLKSAATHRTELIKKIF